MHRLSLTLTALILCFLPAAHAQSSGAPLDGAIVSRKAYALPAFEAVKEIAQYATPSEYAEAVADKEFVLERTEYASDGLTVSAYLYRPTKTSGRYPVIVFNRGSYVVHDQGAVLLTMFRRLAKAGFVVIAPMLRGSDGTSGKDELGGTELHDIANVFGIIKQLEFTDSNSVFMYGESRGGIMTLLSCKANMPIKAAATFGAITDMADYLQRREWEAKSASKIWPNFEQNRVEILHSRSAQQWADQLNIPILLMHGAQDPQVPPVQTLQLAEKLAAANKNYGVIIYPGDNHILAHNRTDRDHRTTEWFRSFISAAPSPNSRQELPQSQ